MREPWNVDGVVVANPVVGVVVVLTAAVNGIAVVRAYLRVDEAANALSKVLVLRVEQLALGGGRRNGSGHDHSFSEGEIKTG